MQNDILKPMILSGVLGGVLVAGIGAVAYGGRPASANTQPVPAAVEPLAIRNAPEVEVPGYSGVLYDPQGHIVGVSVPRKSSAAGAPVNRYGHTYAGEGSSYPSSPAATQAHPQGRSLGKSAAIVAGSAGAGAAIGAVAGGGKGAAIGALSGGTAGFVYDRITAHPKK